MSQQKDHNFKPKRHALLTHIYLELLPGIREVAKSCGYAVAIHGSLVRDFDLIAVPWVPGAVPAEKLVDRITQEVEGTITRDDQERKPHGRRAWSIGLFQAGAYIDLSVLPRESDL